MKEKIYLLPVTNAEAQGIADIVEDVKIAI
jgi:hypothetical protein